MTDSAEPRRPMLPWQHLVPVLCVCGEPLLLPIGPKGAACKKCNRRFVLGDKKESP